MTATVFVNQAPFTALGSPVLSDGVTPSKATLSNISYGSSDPNVFTVGPNPANPLGAMVTIVGVGTATLTESATGTEPDGKTTEPLKGVATIIVNAVAPPPPPPAAELAIDFGLPVSDIS